MIAGLAMVLMAIPPDLSLGWKLGLVAIGLAAIGVGFFALRRSGSREGSSEVLPIDPDQRADKDFAEIIGQLRHSIRRERRIAIVIGILAASTAIAGIVGLFFVSKWGLDKIEDVAGTGDSAALTATTLYLLVRGAALAGLVATLLFSVVSLARSALDQATRFDKRLIAARFIDYAVHSREVDAKKMKLAMEVLHAWAASVESAYTPAKYAHKRSEILEVKAGKEGGELRHGTTHDE